MRIPVPSNVNSDNAKDNFKNIDIAIRSFERLLNGMIELDNIRAVMVDVKRTSGTAADQIEVQHPLGRTPSYFIVLDRDGFGNIKRGTSSWSNKSAFFNTDTINVSFKVLLL